MTRWYPLAALSIAVAALLAACRQPAPTPSPKPVQPWRRPAVIDFHGHLSLEGSARLEQIWAANGIGGMVNLSGGSYQIGRAHV